MGNKINSLQTLNLKYLANIDIYDLLSDEELKWLFSSNVPEERIIAEQLLRNRCITLQGSHWQDLLSELKN